MTDRAAFLAQLYTQPLLRGDAIIVLCGEDAEDRVAFAAQLFKSGAAERIVLSGGRHEPPSILGAEQAMGPLLGLGIAPERIILETMSQNTREQAEQILTLAEAEGWRRILLVASGYHLARAFLTFVAALQVHIPRLPESATGEEKADAFLNGLRLHVVPVAASQSPWSKTPPGVDRTRAELFHVESVKITEYGATGDCASYADGLAYLQHWENAR